MGNALREKNSGICSRDHENTGGCSWGVRHMIKYDHWRHFMKRVTHHKRRHLLGNLTKAPSDEKSQEDDAQMDKSIVEEKTKSSIPRKCNSVKARIKSFLPEEMYKRKGRHQQSSSCPVQPDLIQSDCIHCSEPADMDRLSKTWELKFQSHENYKIVSATNDLDSLPMTGNEKCSECNKIIVGDHLEPGDVDEHQIVLKRHNEDSSRSRPKEYLDALDIISTNKELLVQLLQDPGSPLAHHFQNQQALSAKRGLLAKAKTFPLTGSSGRSGSGASRFKQMPEAQRGVEETVGISRNTALASAKQRENLVETRVVTKSFKDLKQKLKHVIKESRKEMRRVAMDAVMHKIPHGRKLEKEIDNKIRTSIIYGEDETDWTVPFRSKNKLHLQHIRRASSLTDSLDRHWQLYESSINRETKQQTSEGLKMKAKEAGLIPKSLARIRSLPDLKSFVNQNDESSDTFSSGVLIKNAAVDSSVGAGSSFDRQKCLDHDLKIDASEESIVKENSVDLGATEDDVTTDEMALTSTENIEGTISLSSQKDEYGSLTEKESERGLVVLDGFSSKKMEELDVVTLEVSETENVEPLDTHFISDLSHLQVAATDKAEFSYVKDVLELSGFSGNTFLGTWHSDEQPVDPLVYEEVEGCLFLDPECCGNELNGKCDHLLLFDLINEVLVEIYARSYSYCPFALSSLSHIRPMPSGPHVLREVWALISWYLSLTPEVDQSVDNVVACGLAKSDAWMSLQYDAECVGLALEDLIFDDLLDDLIWA